MRNVTLERGHADKTALDTFFAADYSKGNLVDMLLVSGDKIISNYLHTVSEIPVDFPRGATNQRLICRFAI